VFNAAMAWATAECERREIDSLPENRRVVLGKKNRVLYFMYIPVNVFQIILLINDHCSFIVQK